MSQDAYGNDPLPPVPHPAEAETRDQARRIASLVRNTSLRWETAAAIVIAEPAVAAIAAKLLRSAAPPHLKR